MIYERGTDSSDLEESGHILFGSYLARIRTR
jgi:hypothetical protein